MKNSRFQVPGWEGREEGEGAGREEGDSGARLPDRLFLHASYLAFFHPVTRGWVAFRSGLPPELERFIEGG